MIILKGILLGIVVLASIFSIIGCFSSSEWFCTVMSWHRAPAKVGFDGISLNGVCPRCGKKVLQDSQGNWF